MVRSINTTYIILDITSSKSSLQKSTIAIVNWLTATEYLYLKSQWIFPLSHFFLSSFIDKTFVGPDYMSVTAGV